MRNIFLFKSEHNYNFNNQHSDIDKRSTNLKSENSYDKKNKTIKKLKFLYQQTKISTKSNLIKETNDNEEEYSNFNNNNQNSNFILNQNSNFMLKHKNNRNNNSIFSFNQMYKSDIFTFNNNINNNDNNSNSNNNYNNNSNFNINKNFEEKNNKSISKKIDNSIINNNISSENFFNKKAKSVFFDGKNSEKPEILVNNLTSMNKKSIILNSVNDYSIHQKFSYKKYNILENKINKKKNNLSANVIPNLSLSCYETIIILICPFIGTNKLKKKNLLLKNGKKKIFETLDILTYLKNLQQIQVLNYILFEEYQINLIEFISKPCISLVNKYSNENYIEKKNDENLEIEKFFNCYKVLIKKKNKNNIEKKLSDTIEKEMKTLLE
jgi:hypothetical protein